MGTQKILDVPLYIARRAWARNPGAKFAAKREEKANANGFHVTPCNECSDELAGKLFPLGKM